MVGGEADAAVVEAEGERRLEPRDERAVLPGVQPGWDAQLDEPQDLRDTDRGDGEDEAGCLREPADDGELDDPARDGQGGGEGAELALGEVDDAVRAVDQDKADSEEPVEHPQDHALEENSARHHGRERMAAADALAHEHTGGEAGGEDSGARQLPTFQMLLLATSVLVGVHLYSGHRVGTCRPLTKGRRIWGCR